jgi:hypothetical protein
MLGIAWNNPAAKIVGPLRATMMTATALSALATASALARLMRRLGAGFGPGRLPISGAQRALASWAICAALLAPGVLLAASAAAGAGGWIIGAEGAAHALAAAALAVRLISAASRRHAATAQSAAPAAVLALSLAAWAAPAWAGVAGMSAAAAWLMVRAGRRIEEDRG